MLVCKFVINTKGKKIKKKKNYYLTNNLVVAYQINKVVIALTNKVVTAFLSEKILLNTNTFSTSTSFKKVGLLWW